MVADNLALFSAIQKATGAKVLPVHLYKTPIAQAGSWRKRGRNLSRFVFDYWWRNARILNACRNDPKAVMLSYEYFCQNPKSELSRLFSALDLDVDPEVLKSWGAQPIHTLGGNHMKFNTSSEIFLDEGWRKALNPVEVKVMQSTCGILWRTMNNRQLSRKASTG